MKQILCAILMLCLPSMSYAQWYLGQASIPYDGDDYNDVRKLAIEQAIENASLQASSYISIENTVRDGILTSSKSNIVSKQQISEIVILNETITAGKLTVNLKVNLHSKSNCIKDAYSKQLIIAQFPLMTPKQAAPGDIYTLPFHVASRFKNELSNQPSVFVEELIPQMVFKPVTSFDSINLKTIQSISHRLNSQFQSQYLVFGYIRDIGLYNEIKSALLTNTIYPKRNFTIKVFMYDRISDSILLEDEYHGEGGWSFDSYSKVDLSNSLFWRSEYGKAIVDTLFKVSQDINQTLSCEATKATVINRDDEFITINIGTMHGVKKGDIFQHIKLKNIPLRNTVMSTLMPPDEPTLLEVIQVSNKISLLKAPENEDVNGINQHQVDLYDVVTTTSF
ncbi:flagellar assembly protein T N-terminal domain-containing protein [Shewanella sp. 10N.7]|uniref:flagellar assembly protein T N-terminal domain-containing protein n=1 Tax=Shewanella sp. 10N.7 TaxID=2885093 RepID=UPI001E50DD95|nr:flagellar assembly protein T N-terminal domain-containing protein [Shewanella sp. 10N.7]MCC4833946.1 flagellar assembly protein T N-terminal domain-containing protein [Shewanella sp. 10N.7]